MSSRRTSRRPSRKPRSPLSLARSLPQLLILLGLAAVVSWLPPPVVELLPPEARELVDLAADTRRAILDALPMGAQETLPPGALPRTPESYSEAKRLLYEVVQAGHRETFYCGCSYSTKGAVGLGSCGLQSLGSESRARRVEAEHVFPASQFGDFRRCWRAPERHAECRGKDGKTLSGRDCCLRVDPVFATAHNDLHNLQPSVGYINGQRSNFVWSDGLRGGERYGRCAIRIDSETRRVMPPAERRGEIARTMLYMRDTYGVRLSHREERLYRDWNNADPPDAWELERERRVTRIQGLPNAYVREYRVLE